MEEYFPGFLAFTDCSAEQPIPRPKHTIRRKMYYSGKKKKHTTVKNLYTANQDGLIVYKTKHNQMGKRHDMTTEYTKRIILIYPKMMY